MLKSQLNYLEKATLEGFESQRLCTPMQRASGEKGLIYLKTIYLLIIKSTLLTFINNINMLWRSEPL